MEAETGSEKLGLYSTDAADRKGHHFGYSLDSFSVSWISSSRIMWVHKSGPLKADSFSYDHEMGLLVFYIEPEVALTCSQQPATEATFILMNPVYSVFKV
jgi:hypothetical protein